MAKDAIISLPEGIEAPLTEDVRNAKEYILSRTRAEVSLSAAVDDILDEYITKIAQACWRYDITPQDFSFAANEDLRREIDKILTDLEEELLTLIKEAAVPEGKDNKHYAALITWMLTLGTHGWNFRRTLRYYIQRFSQDVEAQIASLRYAGTSLSKAISRMRTTLHTPYSLSELVAAMKSGKYFIADMIRTGGTKIDPITRKATVGLSKVGATNITTMLRSTLAMAWMRDLFLNAEEEGRAGYYVFRGSSYECAMCDDECGWFHPISQGLVVPIHAHCCCYIVFVKSQDEEPVIYRPTRFY